MTKLDFVRNSFWPKFGKKGPKTRVFACFSKYCDLLFQKTMQNESSVNSWLFNSISGKILVLKLFQKTLLTNQIAGFIKVISVKKIWTTMLIFCLQINIRVSYMLVQLSLPCMTKVGKITDLKYLYNISRKSGGINMIFCMKINIKLFYKLVVLFSLVTVRHVQNTENGKPVISLQYLKKEWGDEVGFLHSDKHQTILQADTTDHGGHRQACPNYTKKQVCQIVVIFQERSEVWSWF